MPKLDLKNALRIKSASGEFSELKGDTFSWVTSFSTTYSYTMSNTRTYVVINVANVILSTTRTYLVLDEV